MELKLRHLREANLMRQAEWDPASKLTLTYQATELCGEVGEACNIVKKFERELLGLRGTRATLQDLADELADVVIVVDLICSRFDIDLGDAIVDKFNKTSVKYGLAIELWPDTGNGVGRILRKPPATEDAAS
jgi:NTP pyrophosphatase (non-canonical NTP hydrolase)